MAKKNENKSQGNVFPSISNDIKCSFCKSKIESKSMAFVENNVVICNECLEIYYDLFEKSNRKIIAETFLKSKSVLTPKIIYDELNKHIISQDEAKKMISVAIYNHYKRISTKSNIEKTNILLIGPTGVGKTLIAKIVATILDIPIAIVDATVYTEAGYVGEDVENMLLTLLQNARFDYEKAKKGIIFIDEIDKLARKSENSSITRDVSGEGVQNSLLKIIEGTIVNVPRSGGRKHPYQDYIKFDTKDVLFIASGAFDGIDSIVKTRVGFNQQKEIQNHEIDTYELQKYGMIPELLGRLPVICRLYPLSENDLYDILIKPHNSLVKQYVNLFKESSVDLEFTNSALRKIAHLACGKKQGARFLKRIMEKSLLNYLFNIDKYQNKKLIIKEENIKI